MSTLQKYKPIPELHELRPGYFAGWKYDVLILQAEPEDRIGSILLTEGTKDDERFASTLARIVRISPTAFRHADWEMASPDALPYQEGDVVLTKRYPAGLKVVGADGRNYMMVKDEEICGLRDETEWATPKERAA